jgi:hypothetical protein
MKMWGKQLSDYMSEEELKGHNWVYKHYDADSKKKKDEFTLKILIVKDKLRRRDALNVKDILTEEEYKYYEWETESLFNHKRKVHDEETIMIFLNDYFDEIFSDLKLEDIMLETQRKEFESFHKKYTKDYDERVKHQINDYVTKYKAHIRRRYLNLRSKLHIAKRQDEYYKAHPEKLEEKKKEQEIIKKNKQDYEDLMQAVEKNTDKEYNKRSSQLVNYQPLTKGPYYYLIRCSRCVRWTIREYHTLIKRKPNKKYNCILCGHRRTIFNKYKGDLAFMGEYYSVKDAQRELFKIQNEKKKDRDHLISELKKSNSVEE